MGRRRNRKRQRRATAAGGPAVLIEDTMSSLFDDDPGYDDDDFGLGGFGFGFGGGPRRMLPLANGKACGSCREFVESADGGRGSCLHPASGIVSPWTDTPGCDYHTRRR
jgi:hypothetical protein